MSTLTINNVVEDRGGNVMVVHEAEHGLIHFSYKSADGTQSCVITIREHEMVQSNLGSEIGG